MFVLMLLIARPRPLSVEGGSKDSPPFAALAVDAVTAEALRRCRTLRRLLLSSVTPPVAAERTGRRVGDRFGFAMEI